MSDVSCCGFELCTNLESWMKNLPDELKRVPLIHLAIPGSHDSCTSSIVWHSKIAPDAELPVQRLKFLGPLLGLFVSRWARTQESNIAGQFASGIRYFDLRVATKRNTEEIFIVHAQYSCNVETVFRETRAFLDEHPEEVIILDCQHFYAFEERNHIRLIDMFEEAFSDKLLPYYADMEHITLEYMNKRGYQVMVVYRSRVTSSQSFLWPSKNLPNPWPETDETDVLIKKLNEGLRTRCRNVGYVSQCVLTPTSRFVLKNWYRTLKSTCAKPLENQKYRWLSQQAPGVGRLNIVISDFVNLDACKFSREVICLNGKLLDRVAVPSLQPLTPVE